MTMPLSQVAVYLAHALAGWALCGATMGIGLAKTSLNRALVIHAVAAPIIFALISTIYFVYFAYSGALATGRGLSRRRHRHGRGRGRAADTARVHDVPKCARNWLPFALIFVATYVTGLLKGR